MSDGTGVIQINQSRRVGFCRDSSCGVPKQTFPHARLRIISLQFEKDARSSCFGVKGTPEIFRLSNNGKEEGGEQVETEK